MRTAKLFKNGEGQAVRLPKEFRFDGDEVLIKKVGNAVVLLPKDTAWDSLVDSLGQFSSDFMADREQPKKNDRRESF
jgi:antitoxin VapB